MPIHFNNGLHGWGYTEEQYRDGLRKAVATVKKHSDGAKLIWATTTPVREKDDLEAFADQTERVKERNKLAAEVMRDNGASTNDLFELVADHPDWQSTDGVHFNTKGNEALANQVTKSVLENLSAAASPRK